MTIFKDKLKSKADVTIGELAGHLTVCKAILVLIINLVLPGIGTWLSGRYVTTKKIVEMQRNLPQQQKRI